MNYTNIKDCIDTSLSKLPTPVYTHQVRTCVRQYKKDIMKLSLDDTFVLCELYLQSRHRHKTLVGYQILDYKHKDFTRDTYHKLEHFVLTYISDWWDCDDYMTHAFMRFYLKYPDILSTVKTWITHDNFAVRRCAPVLLVIPARKGLANMNDVFSLCDLLINDPHYLVLKGYGWLLKEASKHYPKEVINYVETHVHDMPRTAFRYALEKLPKEERKRLLSLTR